MTAIHKLSSDWKDKLTWNSAHTRIYPMHNGSVLETWLIGKAENAQNFAIRYYNVSVGSSTREESHAHDHGIVILHGKALVTLEDEEHKAGTGDVIYISPNTKHQLKNIGTENLGFICVIPARRMKGANEVWAEAELFEDS